MFLHTFGHIFLIYSSNGFMNVLMSFSHFHSSFPSLSPFSDSPPSLSSYAKTLSPLNSSLLSHHCACVHVCMCVHARMCVCMCAYSLSLIGLFAYPWRWVFYWVKGNLSARPYLNIFPQHFTLHINKTYKSFMKVTDAVVCYMAMLLSSVTAWCGVDGLIKL